MVFEEKLKRCVDKIEGVTDLSWQDLVNELELGVHPDTLRKSLAVGELSGYKIYRHMMDKLTDKTYDEEDVLLEIEHQKTELYKEKVKLRDQRRELNKINTAEARFENIMEVLQESVQALVLNPYVPMKEVDKVDSLADIATLLISDTHIGLHVDTPINYFDIAEATSRLEELYTQTVTSCEYAGVTKLNICVNGDLCNGIIQLGCRVDQEEDIVDQMLIASDLLSGIIGRLSEKFEVTVYATYGNHSRVVADKKSSISRENFERMMFEYMKLKVPHVPFITSLASDYLAFKINGKLAVLTHGDKDTIANCTQHFTNVLKVKPDYIFLGHIHHHNVKNDNNTLIVVNGSLIGADDYALGLRLTSQASQTLILHGKNDMVTEIKLG